MAGGWIRESAGRMVKGLAGAATADDRLEACPTRTASEMWLRKIRQRGTWLPVFAGTSPQRLAVPRGFVVGTVAAYVGQMRGIQAGRLAYKPGHAAGSRVHPAGAVYLVGAGGGH